MQEYLDFFFKDLPYGFQIYLAIVGVLFHVALLQSLLRGDFFQFEKQVAFYKSYHSEKVNVAIHFACIWPILWSYLVFFGQSEAWLPTPSWFPASCSLNLAFYIACVYSLIYIVMDSEGRILGVLAALQVMVFYYIAQEFAAGNLGVSTAEALYYTRYIHVFSWVAQFWGHGVHEGRAPALFTNLAQSFVMAPLFVFVEFWWMFGVYKDLEKRTEKEVAIFQQQFKDKSG